jgi:hypothetical protein
LFTSFYSDNFAASSTALVPSSPVATTSVQTAMPVPQTRGQWGNLLGGLLGPPEPNRPYNDQIVQDLIIQPYRSPYDGIDPYGHVTPQMNRHWNELYRDEPITRSGVRGKADDICILEPAVLAQNRNDPIQSKAAEFVKWTISQAPGGWAGQFDQVYTPGAINGWSINEKKRKLVHWEGRAMDGMGHLRSIDTALIRLQLDQFRNVISVVNMIRGLEYFEPDDVVLYTHNGMFGNPFGQSDIRTASRSADIIQDAYRVWFVAMTVYGLPYMHAMGPEVQHQALLTAVANLRANGYCVTPPECTLDVVNLASAAGTDSFEKFIHLNRENIFYATRGSALPFLEGDGGKDSHGDTDIQQGTSDAGERMAAKRLEAVWNEQIIPWLVRPNFGNILMPYLVIGGTDWKQTKDVISIYKDAIALGAKPSAEQFYARTSLVPARPGGGDVLTPPQQGGGPGGMPGAPGAGGAAPGGGPPSLPPAGGASPAPEPQTQMAAFSAAYRPHAVADEKTDPATIARAVERLMFEHRGAA